ncbi:GcrA family cell cycle regulator [Paenibacillus vulneris]|uniref:Calcineurin-like phosphoesterase domain-containing protein n=1 Tax=Paenibacillus vulneris TaxID=1133364 RepID=A0ABW3UGN3_9BACL
MNHSKLLQIGIKKRNKEINESWQDLANAHSNGLFVTGEAYRCWVKSQLRSKDAKLEKPSTINDKNVSNYKEQVEIQKDGTQTSNKLVHMSIENSKNVEFLLTAHGYDKSEWELVSAKSNIWNSYSKQDGVLQLYASKITVKPRNDHYGFQQIIEAIKNVQPIVIDTTSFDSKENKLLEIPLFDAHFGISDYEYYKQTQLRILDKINLRKWDEILFVIGQDMFHNNDLKGNTANGTPIEKVDMQKAWEDCCLFYEPMIEKSLKQSKYVKIIYSKGNHDEAISWAFVKYLKARYPQIDCDDEIVERKIHTFGEVFIGITHGDKAKKDLHNIFIHEFPLEWAKAKTREIHKGHFHVEDGKDIFGTMIRTLSTRNKTDSWHRDNGFVGAHKRFMLFEYNLQELDSIHYV